MSEAISKQVQELGISTTELGKRLGFHISSDFIESLGIVPQVKTKVGIYWYESDFGNICIQIQRHLEQKTKEWLK